MKKRPWTTSERRMLLRIDLTDAEIGRLIDRTQVAVKVARQRFGMVPKAPTHGRFWPLPVTMAKRVQAVGFDLS